MIRITRTDGHHPDFIRLVSELDQVLAGLDGVEHAFYHQFNTITDIRYAVVAYEDAVAIACGAIKVFSPGVMEVKRMYTAPAFRNRGAASLVLVELQHWAMTLGASSLVLETGLRQLEAVALYEKHGFVRTPNYGPYQGVENSICFFKSLESSVSENTD